MGFTEKEVLAKSRGEIKAIFSAFDKLQEMSKNKPGTTFKVRRKKKKGRR